MLAFDAGVGAGTSSVAGSLENIFANLPFPSRDFLPVYGPYIDSCRFSVMRMNGDSGLPGMLGVSTVAIR